MSSATKKSWGGALHIKVVDRTFLNVHIFDQVVLLTFNYDSNNSQILLSPVIVISATEDI